MLLWHELIFNGYKQAGAPGLRLVGLGAVYLQ